MLISCPMCPDLVIYTRARTLYGRARTVYEHELLAKDVCSRLLAVTFVKDEDCELAGGVTDILSLRLRACCLSA